MLKIGEIRELIRLLDETSLAELRIETDDMKLSLKKPEQITATMVPATVNVAPLPAPSVSAPTLVASQAVTTGPAQAASVPEAARAPEAVVEDTSLHTITSPMVGTFYRAPGPDAAPFVETGTKVNEKSVVCIVEAMKLLNEIEAEVRGEVVEVLAQNGQLVEYGQPLFKIRLA